MNGGIGLGYPELLTGTFAFPNTVRKRASSGKGHHLVSHFLRNWDLFAMLLACRVQDVAYPPIFLAGARFHLAPLPLPPRCLSNQSAQGTKSSKSVGHTCSAPLRTTSSAGTPAVFRRSIIVSAC
jgi:hypothetical protein